jgi:phosphoglycerol transferase
MIATPLSTLVKTEWRVWLPLAVLSFLGASLFMTGWPNGLFPELTAPFSYAGDGMAYLWNVQRVIEGSWYFENARSGFPFGSNHLDYPTSDTGSYLALKLLGFVFNSAAAVLNLYYLLGFSLCAAATYWVARSLGVTRHFSIVVALLYAFTSFHFGRLGHLFFTWYFVAPLFFYVGFRLFSKQTIFSNTTLSWHTKLLNALALIGLASFGIYYALFGCIVIATSALLASALHRSWRYVYEGSLVLFFVVLGVLLNILPSLLYIFENGENREGIARFAAESELYALKITQMLLPRGDHRLDTFFEFASKYNSSFPLITENISASLGAVGALGFVFLLVTVVFSPFVTVKSALSQFQETGKSATTTISYQLRFQILAALSLCLVLIGTIGGFSSLFAMLISTSIRSWNRVSIFIGFLSLLALLMAIDSLALKYFKTISAKIAAVGIAIVILVFGILDQTVKPCHACLAANSALFSSDKAFIQSIEKSLPENSAIYQLPYMAYSDNGAVNNLGSYDQARGHLHSKHLRWSFGGVRGREGDWFFRKLSVLPIKEQVAVVSAMGFAGIYIDRRGYLETISEQDKQCLPPATSQVVRLKKRCITVTELEQSILSAIPPESARDLKYLTSQDQQLSFIALDKAVNDVAITAQANSYLQSIGFKLVDRMPVQLEGGFEEAIDLRKDDPDLPVYLGSVNGFAGISIKNGERIGRWSDALVAKHVTVWLAKPLPKKFTLHIRAQAAGLNAGKPMQVKIGKQIKEIIFGSEFETKTVSFEIDEPVYKIEFKPADPFSPARRWGYGDTRLIAVLFQQILIVTN